MKPASSRFFCEPRSSTFLRFDRLIATGAFGRSRRGLYSRRSPTRHTSRLRERPGYLIHPLGVWSNLERAFSIRLLNALVLRLPILIARVQLKRRNQVWRPSGDLDSIVDLAHRGLARPNIRAVTPGVESPRHSPILSR